MGVGADMSTTTRSPLIVLALLLATMLIAACSSASSGGSGSPTAPTSSKTPSTPPVSDASVTIETVGGHCLEGACGGTVTISADGTVKQTAPRPADLGTLSEPALEALMTEIEQANFDAIKSHPFTDTCPIAFDGQQFIYTFTVGSQVEKIDSCEVVVDPANPLFVAVEAALAEVVPS